MPLSQIVRHLFNTSKEILVRLAAILLLLSLSLPMIMFAQWNKTYARTIEVKPRPISAAPQPYVIGEGRSKAFEVLESVKLHIGEVIFPRELPDEFKLAERPGLVKRLWSKIRPTLNVTAKSAETTAPIQPPATVDFDYDEDTKSDVSRWDPVNKVFQIKYSGGGGISPTFSSASSGAKPVPADYDGDGNADAAVFDSGTWYIRTSSDGNTVTKTLGQAGDIPASGNYLTSSTGDELAVYRPSNGTWYWRELGNATVHSLVWGVSTDVPVAGDYDGDGGMDWSVYRPSTGYWWILFNTGGYTAAPWGIAEDIPVAADYDGDGKTDFAVFRPSSGTWWIYKSNTATYDAINWGNWADQPVIGDFNGDGKADPAVWRPSSGVWYVDHTNLTTFEYHTLGSAGEVAANSAYVKQVGGSVSSDALSLARLTPRNATGSTDLYSQNFAWGRNLVSLPGRSGLDLNIGLSYNSLVWTKQGSTVHFDTNYDNVTPGFNLGFATIEPAFYDSTEGKWNYLMITPSGARVQFRQVGATSVYETLDSSYLQLKMDPADTPDDPPNDIQFDVYGTDGTRMSYSWFAGAFRCVKITDRNGNYLSMEYNQYGYLETATDTLGREIKVNYDSQFYPTLISQTWKTDNGASSNTTHSWATFTYTTTEIQTDFDGVTVAGPPNGTYIKVLQKVTYPDTSWTKFLYNGYGQVKKIENYADDDHLLSYTRTNLDSVAADQTDCPRFTLTASKIENFNLSGGAGTEQEVVVTNSAPASDSDTLPGSISISGKFVDVGVTGHPDGLYSRIWYGSSGFKEGLNLATQDCTGTDCSTVKRWTWSDWTQDDTVASYQVNPRVKESRVGDGTNTKKTTIKYLDVTSMNPVATYGLVSEVEVGDLSTVKKKSTVTYNDSSHYTTLRILGLPEETNSWGWNDLTSNLEHVSKVTFEYDEGDFSDTGLQQNISPVQHDSTNYGSTHISGRGNLTSTKRWDVINTSSSITTAELKYNTAGSIVSKTTPWDGTSTRTVKIRYSDVWNSSGNPATFAYSTSITDPANNSSTVKYRYDIGANVEATSPAPAGQTYGKTTKRVFDAVGRLQKNSVYVNTTEQSYSRYEYPSNGVQSKLYATVVDVDGDGNIQEDEAYSESWFDGAGRPLRSRAEHPNSSEGWASTFTEYDLLGRVSRRSEPLETDASYDWAGGDDSVGPLWKHFDYDWMGRIIRQVNTDGNPTQSNDSDVLISYAGCGCAGGLITTVQGELVLEPGTTNLRRRTQKSHADILGRTVKSESFQWNGTSPDLTTETKFNGRDQAIEIVQTDEITATSQTSTIGYDGHGRQYQTHRPEQRDMSDNLKYTTYSYNMDDSILSVEDGRGAVTNFEYNSRGLLVEKSWTVPGGSGIADPTDVTFSYDNLGNRTQMTDGMGVVNYEYNPLSQMTAEARNFSDTLTGEPGTGVYRTEYTYRQTGQLASITEPFGETINFSHDKVNRPTGVDPTTQLGDLPQNSSVVEDMQYRSFGALKHAEYGNGTQVTMAYNTRLQPSEYRLINSSNSQTIFGKEYYYANETGGNDGLLKSSIHLDDTNTATNNEKLDRTNKYDMIGRIKSSDAGTFDWSPFGGPVLTNGEYQMKLTYDAFGNITSNADRDFHQNGIGCVGCPRSFTYSETVTNNRTISSSFSLGGYVTNYSYDNDGRPTVRDNESHDYDATGKRIATDVGTTASSDYFYDGDQRLVKENANGAPKTYFVRSGVLDAVLLELTPSGSIEKTYLMTPSGSMLGQVSNGEFLFLHTDPSGADTRAYKVDKSAGGVADMTGIYDPLGRLRTGGAYNGGGPCIPNQTCPPGYNPPSASGYDWMGMLTSMRNAEWLKYRMFSIMELNLTLERKQVEIPGEGHPADPVVGEEDTVFDNWESIGVRSTTFDYFVGTLNLNFSIVPGMSCQDALNQAGKTQAGLARALADLPRITQLVGDDNVARLLAAIGLQESDFQNVKQLGGGPGRGIFQIEPKPYGITETDAMNLDSAVNAIANKWSQQWSDTLTALGNAGYNTSDSNVQYWALGGLARIHNRWRPGVIESKKGSLFVGSLLQSGLNSGNMNDLDNPGKRIDKRVKATANGTYVRNVMDIFFSCLGG